MDDAQDSDDTLTSPQTLLIAAPEPSQSAVLAELILALRPGLKIEDFGDEGSAGDVDLMMVAEIGAEVGELSRRVRARHPGVPLVLIAPHFDTHAVALAAEVEAAAILASPCEPRAVARVLERQQRMVRFAGRCNSVETDLLLRLHAAASSDGILHLASAGREGAIHIEGGQPIHAQCGDLVGLSAMQELLGWTGTKATWMAGRSAAPRTISIRIESVLEREIVGETVRVEVEEAPRVVLDRIERLSQAEDILGAFLLRNSEVIMGHNDASLDPVVTARALSRLSLVFEEMQQQQGDRGGTEIQATVGEHRLVVDRLGPTRLGFQVGVVVRQATPVCKSLRRLLRQIDRSFRKSLQAAARGQSGGASDPSPRGASGLHRVA